MTLEEAIDKLYTLEADMGGLTRGAPRARAVRLGIDALKEIKRARTHGYRFAAVRLPRETEPTQRRKTCKEESGHSR